MVSNDDYVKKVLKQILDSQNILQNLKDQSGDLDIIKIELLKIIKNCGITFIANKVSIKK